MIRAALLALTLLVPTQVGAGTMGLLGAGSGSTTTGAGGCTEATTFIARTSGLSGTESTAYTTMICGMVTDGTWALLDVFYIFATNTTTTAALNLKSTSFTITANNTPTFTADQGWTGSLTTGGSGKWLDTGYVPSTNGVQCTVNACSIGVYDRTNRTTSANVTEIGALVSPTSFLGIQSNFTGNVLLGDVSAWNFPSTAMSTAQGFSMAVRTSSTALQFYKNGSATGGSQSSASPSLANVSVYILCYQQSGSAGATSASADQIAAAFVGNTLTSGQAGNISSRVNAFMTAVGANVY